MNPYVKAILAAAVPLITALGSYITTGELDAAQLSIAITGLITAVLVYFFRNAESGVLNSTKAIVAAATPLISALIQSLASGSWDRAEWATLVVGFLTAILVYISQNESAPGGQAAVPRAR